MLCLKCNTDKPDESFRVNIRTGLRKKWCMKCVGKQSYRQRKNRPAHVSKEHCGNSYLSRWKNLRLIGFANYQDYLQSDLWKSIREKVYAIKGEYCYLCGLPATELHHNRYHLNDLLGKKLKYINPICNKCHHQIEFRGEEKNDVRQAKSAFKRAAKVLKKAVAVPV